MLPEAAGIRGTEDMDLRGRSKFGIIDVRRQARKGLASSIKAKEV